MSDYPSDDEVEGWWVEGAPCERLSAMCRRVARRAVDWARANPAPQEPPIGADPAMTVGIVDDEDDDGWYHYDPGDGRIHTHDAANLAREHAEGALEEYREKALSDSEWDMDAGSIHWGRLVPHGWTEEVTEGEHTDYVMREAAPQEPTCSVCGFTPCLGPKCRLATPRTSADKPPAPRDALVKHDEPCCPRNPSPTPEPR